MLLVAQIQEIRNNLARLLGKVKVTDGTNDMPAMDAAGRAGYVRITDGTNAASVSKTCRTVNSYFFPPRPVRYENDHGVVVADWSSDTSNTRTQDSGYDLHITGITLNMKAGNDPTAELQVQPVPVIVSVRDTTSSAQLYLSLWSLSANASEDVRAFNLKVPAGHNWVTDVRLGGATNFQIYVVIHGFEEAV